MELLFSNIKRTGRVADLLQRAGGRVKNYVVPLSKIDLIRVDTEDGMSVSVWVEESGPLKFNCDVLEVFEEEAERAIEAFHAYTSPAGVKCVLNNGSVNMEMTVDREEDLEEKTRFLFRILRQARLFFLRMLHESGEAETLPSEVVRSVLQEEGEKWLATRYPGGGWDFLLEDGEESVDVFAAPDGYGFVRFWVEENLPENAWPELMNWMVEMYRKEYPVALHLEEAGWRVEVEADVEFLLTGDECADRDAVRFSLEDAREKSRLCRQEMDAFLKREPAGN